MRLCIPIPPIHIGGPSSFKRKFEKGLKEHGIEVVYDLKAEPYDLVLVVGCTRHIQALRQCKKRGIPIVQRLDGFNWYTRALPLTSRERWQDSFRNYLMRFTRAHIADYVIYQSQFIRDWWHADYGPAPAPECVIYNGVDTDLFSPQGEAIPRDPGISLVTVEGELGIHERVLRTPIDTWRRLNSAGRPVQLHLVGQCTETMRRLIPDDERVRYAGIVPNATLPTYLRGATAFISAEVNPPCPNSVIEALTCGTPVVGFATGSLPELVSESAGLCVEYGADPWKLEVPDIASLADAVERVASDYGRFSAGARRLALERYSLKKMVSSYLAVFSQTLGHPIVSPANAEAIGSAND